MRLDENDAVLYTYVTADHVYLNACREAPHSEAPFDAGAVWTLAKFNPEFLSKRTVGKSKGVFDCVVVVTLRSGEICIKHTQSGRCVLTPVELGHEKI